MNETVNVLNNLIYIWPALLMGAIIPAGVLLTLFFSKKKKEISFKSALYGFGTFFVVLAAVAVLLLVLAQVFLTGVSISAEADANSYIYMGGAVVLLLFWLLSEVLKAISFDNAMKSEQKEEAGLAFGSGFILAQNLLIFGLIFLGELDMSQAMAFGLLMLMSGGIYILVSAVGYRMAQEKQRYAGAAVALSYFALFAVMLIFSNVYITYGCLAAVLVFNLIIAYLTLPLPFKKKKEGSV